MGFLRSVSAYKIEPVIGNEEACDVTRVSEITGNIATRRLPLRPAEFGSLVARWCSGAELIQEVFPMLSADNREFILTGMTPEEWDIIVEDEE